MSKWGGGGHRIPQNVRNGLTHRIQMTMNKWLKGGDYDNLWELCEEAAKNIGCTPWTVWSWYTGKSLPMYHNLFAFCDEFEVSLDYLAGRVGAREILKKVA